ncbi:hypothetical protein GCM10023336_73200 [Streptomyces similanensis]|uniref:Secreted protein n=1 Tax=Streptomyces similanensis TaxID=1274988 RepID=A0ABP9LK27_9ACTN
MVWWSPRQRVRATSAAAATSSWSTPFVPVLVLISSASVESARGRDAPGRLLGASAIIPPGGGRPPAKAAAGRARREEAEVTETGRARSQPCPLLRIRLRALASEHDGPA